MLLTDPFATYKLLASAVELVTDVSTKIVYNAALGLSNLCLTALFLLCVDLGKIDDLLRYFYLLLCSSLVLSGFHTLLLFLFCPKR